MSAGVEGISPPQRLDGREEGDRERVRERERERERERAPGREGEGGRESEREREEEGGRGREGNKQREGNDELTCGFSLRAAVTVASTQPPCAAVVKVDR